MKTSFLLAFLLVAVLMAGNAFAVTNLGTGTAALLDFDLTDPEGDGNDSGPEDADGNGLFNATFFSNAAAAENSFSNSTGGGAHEAAFDLFDNKVGSGEAKYCCNSGTNIVGADFRGKLLDSPFEFIELTHFTIASDNDSGIDRDPDVWFIEGSNDGSLWDIIFEYNKNGDSPFDDFGGSPDNRVLRYDVGVDFAEPGLYQLLRFRSTSYGSQNVLGLSELEFFGNIVTIPEPATASLGLLGLAGLMLRRRRAAK